MPFPPEMQRVIDEGYANVLGTGGVRAASLFARLVAYRMNPSGDPTKPGWLKKGGGNNYEGYSVDALVLNADPNDLHNVVDVVAAAEAPAAHPVWPAPVIRRSVDTWERPRPLSEADLAFLRGGQPAPVGSCALGVSWFGALGLYKHDRPKFDDTLRFHRDVLKPDYARVFWYLAGGPWGLIGTGEVSDSARRALLVAVIESLLNANIKPQVTVFGTWVPDNGRRLDLVQQFRDTVQRYAASLFAIDCVNEPGAIGVPEYGYVREIGRMLTGLHVPLLSLASPNSLHMGVDGRRATDAEVIADARKLYGDMPAEINCITPHWGRAPWEPHRELGLPHLKQINDEPRGYQSSVSEIRLPLHFAQDYEGSARAGDVGHTTHGEPGVWDGYCDTRGHPEWAHHNDVRRWQDVPQIDQIVELLHRVRAGQSLPGGGGGGGHPTEDHMAKHPYPSEPEYWADFERRLSEIYAKAGVIVPADALQSGRFFARTAWDLADHLTPAESAEKHLKELADQLGVTP